jgi:hypothetical protein
MRTKVGRLQRVNQLRDESDSCRQDCLRPQKPYPEWQHIGPTAQIRSRGVDDNEPVLIGHLVPLTYFHLSVRPQRSGVHADDEGRWLGAIVAPWDIEQVLPLLARGDDGAVGSIRGVGRK